jgi:hypothetical protein
MKEGHEVKKDKACRRTGHEKDRVRKRHGVKKDRV